MESNNMLLSCEFLKRVLEREGGYVDHPDDRGGPTKYGITLQTLSEYRKDEVSREDIQALEPVEAMEIYGSLYWVGPRFNTLALDLKTAELVFDAAVNHGIDWTTRTLQGFVGVKQDGIIGPVTRGEITHSRSNYLYKHLIFARLDLYATIVFNDSSQAVFMKGWMNRMKYFLLLLN